MPMSAMCTWHFLHCALLIALQVARILPRSPQQPQVSPAQAVSPVPFAAAAAALMQVAAVRAAAGNSGSGAGPSANPALTRLLQLASTPSARGACCTGCSRLLSQQEDLASGKSGGRCISCLRKLMQVCVRSQWAAASTRSAGRSGTECSMIKCSYCWLDSHSYRHFVSCWLKSPLNCTVGSWQGQGGRWGTADTCVHHAAAAADVADCPLRSRPSRVGCAISAGRQATRRCCSAATAHCCCTQRATEAGASRRSVTSARVRGLA